MARRLNWRACHLPMRGAKGMDESFHAGGSLDIAGNRNDNKFRPAAVVASRLSPQRQGPHELKQGRLLGRVSDGRDWNIDGCQRRPRGRRDRRHSPANLRI